LLFTLFRLRLAYRAIWLPQVQEAYMPSFRAADAFIERLIADRAFFFHNNIVASLALHPKKAGIWAEGLIERRLSLQRSAEAESLRLQEALTTFS
jgi:hypothetical protein